MEWRRRKINNFEKESKEWLKNLAEREGKRAGEGKIRSRQHRRTRTTGSTHTQSSLYFNHTDQPRVVRLAGYDVDFVDN